MKPLLFIVAVCLLGCQESAPPPKIDETKNVVISSMNNPAFMIIEIDGCEYVLYKQRESTAYSGAWTCGLTHKGNCKYCIQRNKPNH